MKENKNYYEVIAKCGHVGRKYYVPIKFAVIAEDGKDAAKMVRQFPRVKHCHKDAILNVMKIDFERFQEIIEANSQDPYLSCHSRQEQKRIENFEQRIKKDLRNQKIEYNQQSRKERVLHKLRKYKLLEESLRKEYYSYAY